MIPLLLFACVCAYTLLYYQHVRRYPRGPFPLPLVGNLYHLKSHNLHKAVHQIGKEYGGCFTLFMPRPVVYFTDHPSIVEALVTKGEHFAGRSHLPPDSLLQKRDQIGVVISDGVLWRELRRISLRILRERGVGKHQMETQVNGSIDEMMHQLKATNDGVTPYDIRIPIQLCTGNVINEILFGFHFAYNDRARFDHFANCVSHHLQDIKNNFYVSIVQAWPWTRVLPIIGSRGCERIVSNISKYHVFIEEEVAKCAENFDTDQEPANYVQAYLAEMKRNPELDLENLHAIIVDFWIAGVETTSTTLRWALLLLMKYNDVQDRIRAELHSVVGRGRRIEMADRPRLPYFQAALSEIQRVANMVSFPVAHRCTEDSVIAGKFIPNDTLISPQYYSGNMDDEVFDKPDEFRPERFLEQDGTVFNKKLSDRLMAFGLGKRVCIGEGLARMELHLVLGNLLSNYRFEPSSPLDLEPIFGSVLLPKPYKCRVVPI
ncbi:hypothetical protein PFISCL1PPCAC_22908 [Pristionchus fissidentatus]|uniref:Cytochrome P450 n=1 Tax=Pristionchus fissidentatus TaxID=1538716 RepID=A0AAV5WKY0_9BILA|nr:hypothetical protein PFISCL1PPCAC_22908 [Pristionchus fissidentatus]